MIRDKSNQWHITKLAIHHRSKDHSIVLNPGTRFTLRQRINVIFRKKKKETDFVLPKADANQSTSQSNYLNVCGVKQRVETWKQYGNRERKSLRERERNAERIMLTKAAFIWSKTVKYNILKYD